MAEANLGSSARPGNDGSHYDASSIQVLEGLEAVRKRPAMYIGDTASAGLHHLIWEVVDNSVDEALQGRCSQIVVTLHKDGSVSVLDDGAGIPTGIHPKLGVPALEVILTKLHAGGKFDKGSYQVSGGLHGVGVSVVNALSEWLEVEVYREDKIFRQTFERGLKSSELTVLGETTQHGTLVRFKADPDIFETTEIVPKIVYKRLRELAYLMGTYGLSLTLVDEAAKTSQDLCFPDGLRDFVRHLNSGKGALHDEVIYVQRTHRDEERDQDYEVEIALQYNDGFNESIFTFVNNINTVEGGTHLSGFKTALTRTFNHVAKINNLVKEKEKPPSGDDLREGLTAVVSVKVPDPQFESQTKIRLGNREVEGIVNTICGEGLRTYLEENPKVGKTIFEKAMQASRAREAARKARDQIRRKSAMERSTLPLKLVDCHRGTNPEDAELFLVEGDSAGGTAVSGRASFQAILPLRGKILNVEKAPIHKVMDHKEIEAIIAAVGTGFVGEEFAEDKLRYHKIVIMTDADVDGSHIRTLLLTFFYRKMPELVKRGFVYVAQPPLYMLQKGQRQVYVHTEQERDTTLLTFGVDTLRMTVGDKAIESHEIEAVLGLLRRLRREAGLQPETDGYGFSDLLRLRRETGEWPTHRLVYRSNRVRSVAGENAIFITKGEAELDRIVHEMQGSLSDLVVSTVGALTEATDLVVEPIHVSKSVKDLVDQAEGHGIALDCFDVAAGEEPTISVKIGSDVKAAHTLVEALGLFRNRSDVKTTRFKGLGEMDADQLWESAMDPDRRMLYQVGFADEVDADNLFNILMGSTVEPRREFIEAHSLEVTNLDV